MCPGDMNWGKLLKIRRILVFSGTFTSFRKFFYCLLSLELVFHVIYESEFYSSTHKYFGCRTLWSHSWLRCIFQQVQIIGKQHKYEIKKRASIGNKSWYWSSKPKLWFFCNESHFKKIIFGETGTKNTYKVIENIKYETLSETHFGKVNISCFGLRFQRKLSEDSTFTPYLKECCSNAKLFIAKYQKNHWFSDVR